MNNIIVQDVCEVYIKDTVTNDAYFFGITTKNEVTQKIKQESLKGGIGNGTVAMIQSEKDLSFKVTTLLSNDDIIAIQSGKVATSGSLTVQGTESVLCSEATSLTLSVAPAGTGTVNVLVVDSAGQTKTATCDITTKKVTITGGEIGKYYNVIFPKSVTGNITSLDSKAFPVNFYVELHTIGFNMETNAVACDIYWIFSKALPDGGISKAYEAGKSNGDDINFTAQLSAGNTEYGKYVVIARDVA